MCDEVGQIEVSVGHSWSAQTDLYVIMVVADGLVPQSAYNKRRARHINRQADWFWRSYDS